jgi:hypothetical protein
MTYWREEQAIAILLCTNRLAALTRFPLRKRMQAMIALTAESIKRQP